MVGTSELGKRKHTSSPIGSGTAAILSIAREIARNGIFFKSNVRLVAFVSLFGFVRLYPCSWFSPRAVKAGEEQGLWGSRDYARKWYQRYPFYNGLDYTDILQESYGSKGLTLR